MKQLLFYVSVLAIVFLGANNLKAQNINFFQGNWKQAQLESQKQNKPIFMDAYASWCEPCKRMDREIFSKPEVAKFFNDNFVNVKFDMEKGDGLALAKTHQVKFYPTYLFFSTEGILVHRGGGYIEAGDFITLGSNSLNENTQYYTLKNTYDYGTRTPDLLYKFAMAAVEASMGDAGTISEEYLQGLAGSKKLLSTENMKLIMQVAQDFNNTAFDIMSQNTAKFVETFGAEKVHTVLGNAMRQKVAEAGKKGNTTAMDEALKFVDANMSDKARRLKPELSMIYFEANKDWAAYCNAAPDYVTLNLMDDAVGLNNVAWNFFEHATDAEQLEDAIKWSKRSISLSNKYYNNDTYTNLLYKAKQYNEAWAAAKITLEKAEKEQVDSKETLNLLFKMAPDMKSEGIEYLLANKAKFVDAYGEKEIDKKCHDLINASIAKAGENKDQAMYNEYVGIARRYYPGEQTKMEPRYQLLYLSAGKDWNAYVDYTANYFNGQNMDDIDLLLEASNVYNNYVSGKLDLYRAKRWAEHILSNAKDKKNYTTVSMYASLLYKIGDTLNSEKYANEAISIGQAEGKDITEMQKLLEKLKK